MTVDEVEVTVENPDPASLTVSLANATVLESAGDVTVTATFDQPVKTSTTVTFTASGGTAAKGTDYTIPATFTGTASVGQSSCHCDGHASPTTRSTRTTKRSTVAATAGSLSATAETVTITDNDTAAVTVSESSLTIVKGSTKTYTVVLATKPVCRR